MTDLQKTIPLISIPISSIPYFREIIASLIIIGVGYLLNRFVIQKSVIKFGDKLQLDSQRFKLLRKISSIFFWIIIVFIILGVFGLDEFLWGLLAAVGFSGIVVGMATRDIVSDIVTGVILFIYRPFMIGDPVEIGDIGGEVLDIGISGVKVKSWSGETVIIPLSKIRTSIIKNFSIDRRRATITFHVDYSSNFTETLKICMEVLDKIPEVMKDPKPIIRIDDLTEQSVKILMLIWFPIDVYWSGYTDVKRKLADAFESKGLKSPVLKIEEKTQES